MYVAFLLFAKIFAIMFIIYSFLIKLKKPSTILSFAINSSFIISPTLLLNLILPNAAITLGSLNFSLKIFIRSLLIFFIKKSFITVIN